jgi:hypothetical protein
MELSYRGQSSYGNTEQRNPARQSIYVDPELNNRHKTPKFEVPPEQGKTIVQALF